MKNGYIGREKNAAGYLAYCAKPICSTDHYDICKGVGCPHRRWLEDWGWGKYKWRFRYKGHYPWRPRESRRISVNDDSWAKSARYEEPPPRNLVKRPHPLFPYLSESWMESIDQDQRQRTPVVDVPSSNKQTTVSRRPLLLDDPIQDGRTLAEDTEVLLPSGQLWLSRPKASGATIEDKQIADLVQLGLLDPVDEEECCIGLNDVMRPESAYSIRYVSRKGPRNGCKRVSTGIWEDDIVGIDDAWDWELL